MATQTPLRIDFDHAHLYASDAEATVRFFRDMFGAELVWDEVVAGARGIRLRLGRAFLMIYDQKPKAPRGGAFHHLGIETDDLAALVQRMAAQGFEFRNAIKRAGSFDYVMVAGPDDLLIELFQCHEPARWGIAGGAGDG